MSNDSVTVHAPRFLLVLVVVNTALIGCGGNPFAPSPSSVFTVPLEVEGRSVGSAIIDTGGGYEVMLRDAFGLKIIDTVDVMAFGGRERVDLTEEFNYGVGGVAAVADSAIVGVSVCDCNGLGYEFFRKTGLVLGLSFSEAHSAFFFEVPERGVTLEFESPPDHLPDFDSAFINVDVGDRCFVTALLDTGARQTVMRRGLLDAAESPLTGLAPVTIRNEFLGTVAASVGLHDNPRLPDLLVGTDVMRAWGDRWYFEYAPRGGTITVIAERFTLHEASGPSIP